MSGIDTNFYSFLMQPSKTRSAVPPMHTIPLEKRRVTRNSLLEPRSHIYNIQGLTASKMRDADADAGKHYYIHLDSYDTTTSRVIEDVSPLLVNPSEFEPGAYYTYIVAAIIGKEPETNKTVVLTETGEPELYTTRSINMYEFGTKHHQIMYRKAIQDEELFKELSKTYKSVEYRVYAAGEIFCINDDTLIFNFISGTYKMKKHIKKTRSKYEEAYFTYLMHSIAPKYSTVLFRPLALIKEENLQLTRKELSRLRRHGVPIFLFDTQNKCNQMRNAAIVQRGLSNKTNKTNKTMITKEELQEIYTRLL